MLINELIINFEWTWNEHGRTWRVDVSYGGSLLWRNNIFSLGTLYSNAHND
jgi:hypothetical protein